MKLSRTWPDGTPKSTDNAFTVTGPSIFAADAAKLGANRFGGTGKPPPKTHPLRNGTSSINTEDARTSCPREEATAKRSL